MLRPFAFVLFLSVFAVHPAAAHPHVFIDARAGFKFNSEGLLSALKITWVYDEFTSLALLAALQLDQDNDGVLSDDDLALIVKAQTIWPDGFEGDTYFEVTGDPVAFGRPTNGVADMVDNRISVSFELPLAAPFAVREKAELRLYDPTYYYAYTTVDVQPVEACDVSLREFEPDQATSKLQRQLLRLSREETPEDEAVGRLFADVVELECS